MATTRKFKTARNSQAINAFLDIITGAIRVGSLNAMQKIADRGITTLTTEVASFGDYTGEMINSYQAAILKDGKLPHGGKRSDFNMSGFLRPNKLYSYNPQSVYIGGKREIRLITSFGRVTNRIAYKSAGRKGRSVSLRNDPNRRVNPLVAETIRMPQKKHYQGYGRDLTAIRAFTPQAKIGYTVVFNNPTPYARKVMDDNFGSHVMPIGRASVIVPHGVLVTLTEGEISKVVNRAKRKLGK